MKEINYLMSDTKTKGQAGFLQAAVRPQVYAMLWHGAAVRLHLLPKSWEEGARLKKAQAGGIKQARLRAVSQLLTEKIQRYAQSLYTEEAILWVAPELEDFMKGFRQPIPEPELAAYILHSLPFREILVLLVDDFTQNGKEWWQETFLKESFTDLNGLYLVTEDGIIPEDSDFFDDLYGQSGLPVSFTERVPATDGRKTAVVDLRTGQRPPLHSLSAGSLYLDLTSEKEKRRILAEKRTDISYISARNYLDTAFKARYNAI